MKLKKTKSAEKDLNWRLFFFFCLGFWRSRCQSSLSGGSHRGSVLLGKLLVPWSSELLSVSKLMSSLKMLSRSLISGSVSRSSGGWFCGCPGAGDAGGVTMVVVPVQRAPNSVFWSCGQFALLTQLAGGTPPCYPATAADGLTQRLQHCLTV